jgi:hypothetical protein
MKKLSILILIIVLFNTCDKKDISGPTIVEGTVYNDSNKIIINYPIILVSELRDFCDCDSREKKIELYTDSIGRYKITFDSESKYKYLIISQENGCYEKFESKIESAQKNKVDFILTSRSTLKLLFNNNIIGDSISLSIYANNRFIGNLDKKIYQEDISNPRLFSVSVLNQIKIVFTLYQGSNIHLDSIKYLKAIQCDTIEYEIKK